MYGLQPMVRAVAGVLLYALFATRVQSKQCFSSIF